MDHQTLDRKIDRLSTNADRWARLDLDTKIELARDFMKRTHEVADKQVKTALQAKNLSPSDPRSAEEWLAGPLISLRNVRLLVHSLESIRRTGKPPLEAGDVRERPNGQVAVDVFPQSNWDKVLYPGFEAEVWMQHDVKRDELRGHMASFYRQESPDGAVQLVLGAGNVASIAPLDAIYKLYAEGRVNIIKMNPVNDYLGEFLEYRFERFIDEGFVDVVYGGAEEGQYLTEHEGIDHIHVTGSDRTHDAIVFGTGEEGQRRMRENDPKIDKSVTSELGNVSPVIVVPGPWSDADLKFHARNIATQLANNAGFNCNAVRTIITPERWEHRDALLDAVAKTLKSIGERNAYYPGAESRFERFVDSHDDVRIVGKRGDGQLPWAILENIDDEHEDHRAFNEEAFCSVTAETRLPGDDPAEFLRNAVEFCNESLWGTLNACMLVHPETEKELGSKLREAIDELRYGSVVLNHWPALSYGLGVTPWGAYPGHTYQDIQSGIGTVHNTLLFDKPQKSVIRGPFRMPMTPPWFVTNDRADDIARKLVDFEADPSIGKYLSIAWSSLWG